MMHFIYSINLSIPACNFSSLSWTSSSLLGPDWHSNSLNMFSKFYHWYPFLVVSTNTRNASFVDLAFRTPYWQYVQCQLQSSAEIFFSAPLVQVPKLKCRLILWDFYLCGFSDLLGGHCLLFQLKTEFPVPAAFSWIFMATTSCRLGSLVICHIICPEEVPSFTFNTTTSECEGLIFVVSGEMLDHFCMYYRLSFPRDDFDRYWPSLCVDVLDNRILANSTIPLALSWDEVWVSATAVSGKSTSESFPHVSVVVINRAYHAAYITVCLVFDTIHVKILASASYI